MKLGGGDVVVVNGGGGNIEAKGVRGDRYSGRGNGGGVGGDGQSEGGQLEGVCGWLRPKNTAEGGLGKGWDDGREMMGRTGELEDLGGSGG